VEFGKALKASDLALVRDVYPSREKALPGVTGELVAEAARAAGHPNVVYLPDRSAIAASLAERLEKGDLLVTMGAGDVVRLGEEYLSRG
jgi:UDP-N-acetylmuramate--alanine ligase